MEGHARIHIDQDPVPQAGRWLQEAGEQVGGEFPLAMSLATVDSRGLPSLRMVLLKSFAADGFRFFTNYESRKAAALLSSRSAALCFFWEKLGRQLSAEGSVERLGAVENEEYFRTRPRGSQLGAWASPQSRPIPGREFLEAKLLELEARFPGEVPLPPNWGGFRLIPERLEFWIARPSRLHERYCFERAPGGWEGRLLAP